MEPPEEHGVEELNAYDAGIEALSSLALHEPRFRKLLSLSLHCNRIDAAGLAGLEHLWCVAWPPALRTHACAARRMRSPACLLTTVVDN